MCGRFVNTTKINTLRKIFDIKESLTKEVDILSYNIAPSNNVNVIFKNDFYYIENINWGINFIDKKNNQLKQLINSRIETLNYKLLFKDSFIKRTCLIPANGYYEWTFKNGEKIPYFIQIPPIETIFFAAIWKFSYIKKQSTKTFSIITKPANYLLNKIHSRMPIIFNYEEANIFMSDNFNFLTEKFISESEGDLDFYPVSKYVNSPNNNSKECIIPLN